MSDGNDQPHNRRARRAAAKQSGKPVAPPTSAPKLKLAQPDYSRPKEKTLLDLYGDHKDLLDKGQPFESHHADGLARDEQGNILQPLSSDEVIGPGADAFFWAVGLSMLHLTLDVLAQAQYRQETGVKALIWKSLSILPVLWPTVYLVRSKTAKRWWLPRQLFLLTVGIASGCYTIMIANKYSYYAVMKQAPPLGTIWIYSVIEMDLPFAAVSLLATTAYLWFNSYSIF